MPAGAESPVYAPYVERYPPDTGAASLWLKNRQPGLWRDKTEHAHTLTLEALVLASFEDDPDGPGQVIEGSAVPSVK